MADETQREITNLIYLGWKPHYIADFLKVKEELINDIIREVGYRPHGDMAHLNNKKVPLQVYVTYWDFSKNKSKYINESDMKDMGDRITNQLIEQWVKQANSLFSHLSEGRFSLELSDVKERVLEFPELYCSFHDFAKHDLKLKNDKKSFKIIISSDNRENGCYLKDGIIFIDYKKVICGENTFPHKGFNTIMMHEIGHGFAGVGHCESEDCLMHQDPNQKMLYLCPEDRRILGWRYFGDLFPLNLEDRL